MESTNNAARKRSHDELDTISGNERGSELSITPLRASFRAASVSAEDLRQALQNSFSNPARHETFSLGDDIAATPTPASSPINKTPPPPILPSRKARRVDNPTTSPPTNNSSTNPQNLPPSQDNAQIAQLFGVGWTRLSNDEDSKAAARGWAKYIENHFPISNPIVVLKSEGLNAFLVEAIQGFFLFADDLKEGRLVSTTWENCIVGLRAYPPVFEGQVSMKAKPISMPAMSSNAGSDSSTTPETSIESSDMDVAQNSMDLD
ncbi:MAG: hypothetical protein M1812_006269 [Candelaria pacifica]|nr:MAG: hypothetical protein M1812_006269 [Candelaria pacifica]